MSECHVAWRSLDGWWLMILRGLSLSRSKQGKPRTNQVIIVASQNKLIAHTRQKHCYGVSINFCRCMWVSFYILMSFISSITESAAQKSLAISLCHRRCVCEAVPLFARIFSRWPFCPLLSLPPMMRSEAIHFCHPCEMISGCHACLSSVTLVNTPFNLGCALELSLCHMWRHNKLNLVLRAKKNNNNFFSAS